MTSNDKRLALQLLGEPYDDDDMMMPIRCRCRYDDDTMMRIFNDKRLAL